MKLNPLLVLLPLMIFIADLQAENAEKSACTREALHKYRSQTFSKLMSGKKYAAAADGLDKFMDANDCWSSLLSEINSGTGLSEEGKKNLEEYLWGVSDITLANLKADRPRKCIEIARMEMDQYFHNPLKTLESEKLDAAFSTNLELCEARRKIMFPEIKAEICEIGNIPKHYQSVPGDALNAEHYEMKKPVSALKVSPETGFDCIAVMELETLKGLLNGFCANAAECEKSEDPSDMEKFLTLQVFGVKTGDAPVFTRLDYENETTGAENLRFQSIGSPWPQKRLKVIS